MGKRVIVTLFVWFAAVHSSGDVDAVVPEAAPKGATFIMRHSKEALSKLHTTPYRAYHEVGFCTRIF